MVYIHRSSRETSRLYTLMNEADDSGRLARLYDYCSCSTLVSMYRVILILLQTSPFVDISCLQQSDLSHPSCILLHSVQHACSWRFLRLSTLTFKRNPNLVNLPLLNTPNCDKYAMSHNFKTEFWANWAIVKEWKISGFSGRSSFSESYSPATRWKSLEARNLGHSRTGKICITCTSILQRCSCSLDCVRRD